MVVESVDLDRAQLDQAFASFRAHYPGYDSTSQLDRLRATEYGRLDAAGQLYLDYTGGSLYADSQVRQHLALLAENVYGNPHSANPTSHAATELVERARDYILEFFNASSDEYFVIFTQNASGAFEARRRIVPVRSGQHLFDDLRQPHSVNGIREFAAAKGEGQLRAGHSARHAHDATRLFAALDLLKPTGNGLLAYPAQSNFSGVQHPLDWIAEAQRRGWDVLLDAAAFVPTNRLDLSRWHPDFVDLSFYKMCGYPTGIGCLIARKSALDKLRPPWYAGERCYLPRSKRAIPTEGNST